MINTLIVGAGAIGQAFALALTHNSHVKLSLYLKEHHAAHARSHGFRVSTLNKARTTQHLRDFEVLTSTNDLHTQGVFDLVLLCVPSTALRNASWLAEFASAIGPQTTVVVFQPGLDDLERCARHFNREQLVCGMLPFMSFASQEGHTQVWIPPFSKIPLSGTEWRTQLVASALKHGGVMSTRTAHDVRAELATTGPLLDMAMVGLAIADWDLKALRSHYDLLELTCDAIRESIAIGSWFSGRSLPTFTRFIRPSLLTAVTWALPKLAPFDIEAFFQKHYTKLASQTDQMLTTRIAHAKTQRLECHALETLAKRYRKHTRPTPQSQTLEREETCLLH